MPDTSAVFADSELIDQVRALQRELRDTRQERDRAEAQLATARESVRWQAGALARSPRRLVRRRRDRKQQAGTAQAAAGAPRRTSSESSAEVLEQRLRQVLAAVGDAAAAEAPLADLLAMITLRIDHTDGEPDLLWLLLVVFTSRFPTTHEVEQLIAARQTGGGAATLDLLLAARRDAPQTWATWAPVELVTRPLVFAGHTATHDLHTGVQRVVREVVPRWSAAHDLAIAKLDEDALIFCSLTHRQAGRVLRWGDDSPRDEPPPTEVRTLLIPWHTTVVLAENAIGRAFGERLTPVARWSGSDVAAIFFDMIPFAMPSSVTPAMSGAFAQYIAVIRECARVSTISRAVGEDLAGLSVAFQNQGLTPPSIAAHPLPLSSEPPEPETDPELAAEVLGPSGYPLVLSVSSIDPRKNHLATLRAAESLWREGHQFQLMFVAGSGWKREQFDREVSAAHGRGRPVRVIEGASESFLWFAYRNARFTVFVSISEGFGLPAAESIAVGTPVVLSNHGSMREIGADGGVEFVDPHSTADVTRGMRLLLTDDDRLAALRAEALRRTLPTWDAYAEDTWSWLVEGEPNQ